MHAISTPLLRHHAVPGAQNVHMASLPGYAAGPVIYDIDHDHEFTLPAEPLSTRLVICLRGGSSHQPVELYPGGNLRQSLYYGRMVVVGPGESPTFVAGSQGAVLLVMVVDSVPEVPEVQRWQLALYEL